MKNIVLIVLLAVLAVGGAGMYLANKDTDDAMESIDTADTSSNGMGLSLGKNGNGGPLKQGSGQGQPNRGNCLADDCLLVDDLDYPAGELSTEVQNALVEALEDEYKAYATYDAVIAKFGSTRPFAMIIGAEEQHIASLKAVFNKYGLEIPENTWVGNVTAPETLQQACQTGVDAEIANADLYNSKLLPVVSEYEDITGVFTNLMNASQEKHLPAFERCN